MVKYISSENKSLPHMFEATTLAEIHAQVQKHTTHKLTPTAVEDIIVYRYIHKNKNKRYAVLTRHISTAPEQSELDILNEWRARRGKAPLSNWFGNKYDLRQAIEVESGQKKTMTQAEEIAHILEGRELPPITHLKPGVARGAYRTRDQARRATRQVPRSAPKKKEIEVQRASRLHNTGVSAASVLAELGIEGRKGRALLRKHNISRSDPDAIRNFFEALSRGADAKRDSKPGNRNRKSKVRAKVPDRRTKAKPTRGVKAKLPRNAGGKLNARKTSKSPDRNGRSGVRVRPKAKRSAGNRSGRKPKARNR